jgi:hypothetical protein
VLIEKRTSRLVGIHFSSFKTVFALKPEVFDFEIPSTVVMKIPVFCFMMSCMSLYLGSMLTNDGRCTCEIKSRIATEIATFNKKRALFTSKMEVKLRKKLVKCYI